MQTILDRFGRVVIPKEVRDAVGLEPGAVLTVEERGEKILLAPLAEGKSLALKEGILVYAGKTVGTLTGAVKAHRAERIKAEGFKNK